MTWGGNHGAHFRGGYCGTRDLTGAGNRVNYCTVVAFPKKELTTGRKERTRQKKKDHHEIKGPEKASGFVKRRGVAPPGFVIQAPAKEKISVLADLVVRLCVGDSVSSRRLFAP